MQENKLKVTVTRFVKVTVTYIFRGKKLSLETTEASNQFTESMDMTDLYTITPTQIVMYVTEHCADCMRAKKYFEANNIPHLRVGLEGNDKATDFVMQVNNGYRSVPTIVFPDGSILVEPNWDELKDKFSDS